MYVSLDVIVISFNMMFASVVESPPSPSLAPSPLCAMNTSIVAVSALLLQKNTTVTAVPPDDPVTSAVAVDPNKLFDIAI
jgi:hypothetical protein